MRLFFLNCLVLAACVIDAAPVHAVDYFWNNANGGAYDEPSHWTPFTPPATQGPGGASDTVNFDLGVAVSTPYPVTDLSRENSRLVVHEDAVRMSIFVNYELSSPGGANPSVVVGASSGDNAFAFILGGGVSVLDTQVVRIGDDAGSGGSVRVDGLVWNNDNFRVGYAGNGILAININASINSANASIAHLAGSTGRAIVQGPWNVGGNFTVGRQGEGFLEISSAGNINSNSSSIGDLSTGVGEVDARTTWTTANSLTVGNSGAGTLTLSSFAADVTSTDAFVGRQAGSNGIVAAGAGAWTINGQLSIGGDADAATSGGDGMVEITGGTVTVAEDVTLFPNGQISLVGGSLDAPIITLQSGGAFDWAGGELTVDTFQGSLSNFGGVLAAREGSNSMLVSGEYLQGPFGELSIGIAGDAASGQFDKLTVGNTAFLGGLLQVELAEEFQPDTSQEYVVVDALNFGIGSFSNVANGERLLLDLSAGSFLVNYGAGSPFDPSQVVLSAYQPPATGDFDDDRDADGNDFLIWQRGGSFDPLSTADLAAWREKFGDPVAHTAATAVPEPAAGVLLAWALTGLPRRRVTG
jgi:T5SS/PEP-CTERM-associated repeat protein